MSGKRIFISDIHLGDDNPATGIPSTIDALDFSLSSCKLQV